jgi:crotonobetainyl-CoA:carnitine CoA-transferase CaiB-like acyl-CoA transferase
MTLAAGKAASGTKGPLAGIRVFELGQIASGSYAGSLLADLRADAVEVEQPDGGEVMRQWPMPRAQEMAV